MSALAPIDPRILEEAADWLVRLHDSAASERDWQACALWRARSSEHARAWAQAERLLGKLGSLPPDLALPVLDRPRRLNRRALLGMLMALPAAGLGWQLAREQGWTADYRSATGERRRIELADGTRILLGTASAIDVHFDAQARFVRLRQGELLVETGRDPAFAGQPHRPLRVGTEQGVMEALGTRFTVRRDEAATRIALQEGAVRITPARAGPAAQRVLQAGEQVSFDRDAIGAPRPLEEAELAWTQGMLLADNMRLGDFARELARWRGGFIQCDPAVAGLRVSGAFPLNDTDRALVMLVSTYPLTAATRLRGYWVSLGPRGASYESAHEG